MRPYYVICWSVFLIGFTFKWLHLEGGLSLMALGCLILLIHNIIYLFMHVKTDPAKVLLYFSFTVITIYAYGRIQYWAWPGPFFPFALLLVATTLIIYLFHVVKGKPLKAPQILLIVYLAFFLILAYIPSYKIYYAVYLNPVLNKESRETDYYSWDNYSWFLNLHGLKTEALEANQKAHQAAERCIDASSEGNARAYLEIIKRHEQLIQADQWDDWGAN